MSSAPQRSGTLAFLGFLAYVLPSAAGLISRYTPFFICISLLHSSLLALFFPSPFLSVLRTLETGIKMQSHIKIQSGMECNGMALSKPSLLQILQWFQMCHSDRTLLAFKDRENRTGTRARGRGKAGALQTFQRDGKTKEVVFLEKDKDVQMPADFQGTNLKPPLPVRGLLWAQLDNRGSFHRCFSLKYIVS